MHEQPPTAAPGPALAAELADLPLAWLLGGGLCAAALALGGQPLGVEGLAAATWLVLVTGALAFGAAALGAPLGPTPRLLLGLALAAGLVAGAPAGSSPAGTQDLSVPWIAALALLAAAVAGPWPAALLRRGVPSAVTSGAASAACLALPFLARTDDGPPAPLPCLLLAVGAGRGLAVWLVPRAPTRWPRIVRGLAGTLVVLMAAGQLAADDPFGALPGSWRGALALHGADRDATGPARAGTDHAVATTTGGGSVGTPSPSPAADGTTETLPAAPAPSVATPDPVDPARLGPELLAPDQAAFHAGWTLSGRGSQLQPTADGARLRFDERSAAWQLVLPDEPASGRWFRFGVWLRLADPEEDDGAVDLLLRDERRLHAFARGLCDPGPEWSWHEVERRFAVKDETSPVSLRIGNDFMEPRAVAVEVRGASLREVLR